MMTSEIITVERRRRWSLADKRRIVAETLEPGVSVSAVARRYGLHGSQVFSWRRLARLGMLDEVGDGRVGGPLFTPVAIAAGGLRAVALIVTPRRGQQRTELAGSRSSF
jgi:transposase